MKIIKKTLCLLLSLAVLLSLCACSDDPKPTEPPETTPTAQGQPDSTDPTQETTDPVVTVDPIGVYRCTGLHTQDETEYHEAPAGNAIEIYDGGYALIYFDDYVYDLSWKVEGDQFTATTVDDFAIPLEGTVKGNVLEAVFDGVYLRFEKKTEQEIAEESVSFLRMMMDGTSQKFAVAYLGWKEETDEFQSWMQQKCPALLSSSPFMSHISEERIIGTAGEVYCVVPREPDSKVTVRRLQDTPYAEEQGVKEVMYEAESGEPFIVICNAGDFYQDTQVIFTDSEENRTLWYPQLGEYGMTVIPDNDDLEEVGYDFSYYSEVYPYGYNIWNSFGWEPATEDYLTSTCWNHYHERVKGDKWVAYYWTLNLSEDGTAQLDLMEEGTTEISALYTGTWSLTEGYDASSMKLDLTCVESLDQFAGEIPQKITDEYAVLRAPESNDVMFGIREGQHNCPIFTEAEDFYSVWSGSVG